MRKMLKFLGLMKYTLSFAVTKEQIIKCGDYYYGEATAFVYQQARDRAIRDLSEKNCSLCDNINHEYGRGVKSQCNKIHSVSH